MEMGIGIEEPPNTLSVGELPGLAAASFAPRSVHGPMHGRPVRAGQSLGPKIGWAILTLLASIYTIALVVPFAPDFPKTADSETSWMLMMHADWHSHPQFGADRIFTYGPYGFCVPPIYYPATYPIMLAVRGAIAAVLLYMIWSLMPAFRRIVDNPVAAALFVFPFVGAITTSDDALFPLCSVLLLVSYFHIDGMKITAKTVLLLAVLALAGLAKFTWLTTNSILVLLLTADQVLFRIRWSFWIPGLYVGFLAALWYAAGQRTSTIIGYVRSGAELAGGYTQAMMLLRGELAELAEFGAAAALLLLLIADADWRLRRGRGVIHSIAIALILLATFKQSFVRPDELHATVGPFVLLAMAMIYAVVIWPMLVKLSHRVIWVAAVILPLMNASAAVAHHRSYGMVGHYCRTIHNATHSIVGVWHLARGDADLKGRYESALAEVRAAEPLPSISGTTDVYPNQQCVAVAYGLDYRPRPVFQSYAAYTPKLAGINLTYLQSERAPENILFDVQTIDARLPSLDDGISWPEILTRYDVVGLYETTALLRRTPSPRAYTLTALTTLTAKFDEVIPVPPVADGVVWANIEVNLSPRGKFVALLYRPPGLLIETQTDAGKKMFRFIAPIARGGFLLSPLIETRGEFVSLASTNWKEDLNSHSVRNIVISSVGFGKVQDPAAYFEPTLTVKFSRLDFPRQDISAITGWNQRFLPPGPIRSKN